jgi:Peptidase A4 family
MPAIRPLVATVIAFLLAGAAAVAVGAGSAGAATRHAPMRLAPNHHHTNSTSTNWSGYAATGGTYTSVTSKWVQPAVTCNGTTAYSSFWVGIDGDTSSTVEQTGTEADCNGSTPVYSAWYEMYPKFPTNYSNPVAPGDHFTGTVTTDGKGNFTLTLADTTRGWTQSVVKKLRSAKLASAEIIAEAPSGSGGVLPLANFGTVSFSGATVNGSTLTSSTPGIDAITMQSGSTVKAQPSSISSGSFSVTWKHA